MSETETPPVDLEQYRGIRLDGARKLGDAELLALIDEFPSIRKVSAYLGFTNSQQRGELADIYRVRGLAEIRPCAVPLIAEHPMRTGNGTLTKGNVTFTNIRREADDAAEKVWAAAQASYDAEAAVNFEQDVASAEIATEFPIGLVPPCDEHLGDLGVNPAAVAGFVKGIASVDGLYTVQNGDILEGGVPGCPDSLRMRQGAKVEWQRRMAERLIEWMADRLLAVTGGQHEFFGQRAADLHFARELARIGNCPFLGPGGTLNLLVGETPYSIGIWHKYLGSSIYAATAGAKRMCREQGPFDVSIVADKHAPAISQEMRQGNVLRTYIRGGTAKLNDEYGKSLGFLNSGFIFPLVILWPFERRMWATADVARGIEYLEFLRKDV